MTNTKTKNVFQRRDAATLENATLDGIIVSDTLELHGHELKDGWIAELSSYMAAVAELKGRGYDVRPLEKLVYTDGKTYEFPNGKYFACHREPDTETTIFNSDLKKLGHKGRDAVELMIKNAVSHDPAEWSMRLAKSKRTGVCQEFNTKKICAALRACDAGVKITEYCGIVPVFKYDPPSSFVSHYEIEMKEMRDRLISANKIKIQNLEEAWLSIKPKNVSRGVARRLWKTKNGGNGIARQTRPTPPPAHFLNSKK